MEIVGDRERFRKAPDAQDELPNNRLEFVDTLKLVRFQRSRDCRLVTDTCTESHGHGPLEWIAT